MADKKSKAKPRRLPKGQRTHIRRLKQAARQAGTVFSEPSRAPRLSELPHREEQT